MSGRGVRLDLVDAVELIGALEFLRDWFDTDPGRLDDSLRGFATDHYRLGDLAADLAAISDRLAQARTVALNEIGAGR